MRSPLKSRSRFPSSTNVVAIVASLAATACVGCGDDECGPMGASTGGLTASSADVTLTYGDLTVSANNDCPAADAPEGVVSMTIEGTQDNAPAGDTMPHLFVLCVPRMDVFTPGSAHTVGVSQSTADLQFIDVFGATADGCTFTFDRTRPPNGTVSARGVCGNGDADGFQLTFDAAISLRRTCGATTDSVAVTVDGTIAVLPR
jgi:hypothetical protein